MEHARLSSLLVIALLQLSQTEISSTLPESWYAANVINDGAYSPKPISEIFSTQSAFSSTNPIIVLQSSTPDPTLFTLPPSTATSTVRTTFSTTERPFERQTEISVVPLPTEQPIQTSSQASVTSQTPPVTIFLDTSTTRQPQPPQLPELSQFQQPPAPPSPPPILSTPQQIQIQTAPQGTPPPQIAQNLPPNYILVYQQAPQFQGYPQGQPQIFLPPVTSTSSLPPVTSTSSPRPSSTVTTPLPPRPISTTSPRTSIPPQAPCPNNTNTRPLMPSYRIRLVAPSGSVTNVKINPPITTTTRRPTTTRTRRNRNNYDGCVSGCGGKKIPICASPLGESPIDPDTLKGFPSVCHMACHNSFRKNLYEKVMDGRCGRLRTRIQLVGSKNKLKRDDLNKASYTVVQGGPSVIEFSPLDS